MQWISKASLMTYVMASTLSLSGCNKAVQTPALEEHALLSVKPYSLKQQPHFTIQREYVGLVQAGQQTKLGVELRGKIDTILVDVGDNVKQGDPLLTLDTQLLATEAEQLRAQQAQITAQLELVKANLQRQKALKAKGFSAASEIDNLKSQQKTLQANLRQLSASFAANQLHLVKSTLIAPYSGVISERHVSQGAVVDAGMPTLTLLASKNKEVHIGIPIEKVNHVIQQPSWTIRIGQHAYPVTLLNPGATVGLNSRTVNFRFSLPDDATVVNGEFAYLNAPEKQLDTGFWVPVSAITDGIRGTWNIFAITDNGAGNKVERRSVQLLYSENDRAYVQGAIKHDEQIIANGLHRLVPGQLVSVIPPAQPQQKTATMPTINNNDGV